MNIVRGTLSDKTSLLHFAFEPRSFGKRKEGGLNRKLGAATFGPFQGIGTRRKVFVFRRKAKASRLATATASALSGAAFFFIHCGRCRPSRKLKGSLSSNSSKFERTEGETSGRREASGALLSGEANKMLL